MTISATFQPKQSSHGPHAAGALLIKFIHARVVIFLSLDLSIESVVLYIPLKCAVHFSWVSGSCSRGPGVCPLPRSVTEQEANDESDTSSHESDSGLPSMGDSRAELRAARAVQVGSLFKTNSNLVALALSLPGVKPCMKAIPTRI